MTPRILCSCLAVLASGALAAEPAADLRANVESYLGSIDTPISEERWKALGPEAGPVLEEIARDDRALPTRRARALEALTAVDAGRAVPVVRSWMDDASRPYVLRSTAIRAAPRVLPASEAAQRLTALLRSASQPALRARAAEALARMGRPGCEAVRAHVSRQPEAHRSNYTRALAACTPQR